jgi:hypothetical protein
MSKFFKRFVVMAAVSMACLLFPAAVYATTAAVTGLTIYETSVESGETMLIDVNTNSSTTHVFAMVGNTRVAALPQGQNAATGNISWRLTIAPTQTQIIDIFVNSADRMDGAVVINVPVTVVASSTGTGTPTSSGTPTASATGVVIFDVAETRGSAANRVILTVETNTVAKEVWVQFGTRFQRARIASQTDDVITWRFTEITLTEPQTVKVSANVEYLNRGAATRDFNVTMQATPPATNSASAGGGRANITGVRANTSNIVVGRNIELTITTNINTTNVWVDVDGRTVTADERSSTRTTKTWRVVVTPNRSQTLTVYANTSDSAEGASTRTHSVTVRERGASNNSMIVSMSAEALFSHNFWWDVDVVVVTDAWANFVWVETDNGSNRHSMTHSSTNPNNGDKTWRISNYNNTTGGSSLRIIAGETSTFSNAEANRTVNINNWNQGWWGVHHISAPVRNAITNVISFSVWTDLNITSLDINHRSHGTNAINASVLNMGNTNNNQRLWEVSFSHLGWAAGTYSFTVTPNNWAGNSVGTTSVIVP